MGPSTCALPTLRDASLRDAPQGEVCVVAHFAKKKGGPGLRRDPPDLSPSKTELDCFLEILGDAEGDLLRRLDLDRLAGRRVAAHACRTVAHLKDAEARDADLVALLEMLHDQTDEVFEGAGGVLLGHARLLGQLGRYLGKRYGWNGRFGCGCGCHSGGV